MRLDRGKEVQPDDARRVELCEEAREGARLSGFAPRAGGQTKQSLTITAAQMRGPPPLRQLPPRAAGCCAALQSCPSAPYRRANEKYAPLLAAGTSHELSQFKLTQMGRALPHTYVPYKCFLPRGSKARRRKFAESSGTRPFPTAQFPQRRHRRSRPLHPPPGSAQEPSEYTNAVCRIREGLLFRRTL